MVYDIDMSRDGISARRTERLRLHNETRQVLIQLKKEQDRVFMAWNWVAAPIFLAGLTVAVFSGIQAGLLIMLVAFCIHIVSIIRMVNRSVLMTIKSYYETGKIDLAVIFTVALIALSRKIIILEPEKYSPLTLVGIGVLILGLVAGYWVTVSLARQR